MTEETINEVIKKLEEKFKLIKKQGYRKGINLYIYMFRSI